MNTRTVVLNGAKMNYDGKLDFSILSDAVTVYDDTAQDQVLERVAGCGIVVEKGFQEGGRIVREKGVRVESLAIIDRMEEGKIVFRPQE